MSMELTKLFDLPVSLCPSDMAVEDGMFIDITDTFSDVIKKHYKRNISITISVGIWKIIQHVQKYRGCTFTEIIDKLVFGSQRCLKCFLSQDMVSFRFTLDHINPMELWALAGKDHLGKSSIHIFFPSEDGCMQVNRRVPRRNHS